jgi:heptosyltransferase-2
MRKILIIKIGALGDVLRTTPLLRVLPGHVTWITSAKAAPLLRDNPYIDRLHCMEDPADAWIGQEYDLVINLEDDMASAKIASDVRKTVIAGACLGEGGITYSESASEWFDMSLISRFGREKADQLKMRNRKTYQDLVFAMIGRPFRREEYVLNMYLSTSVEPGLVGLEARAGDVWPMKRWNKYEELAERLEAAGFKIKIFRQRERLADYADDINACEYVVCGDTLAMHLGLALRKKVAAIFTCTAPHEICDYGRMIRVVSPLYTTYFYRRDFVPEAADAIPTDAVFQAVRQLAETVPVPS